MPRMDPVARMQDRAAQAAYLKKQRAAKVNDAMNKSPIQRIGEGLIKAYEDIRGLNTGGPESGRIARKKAIQKAQKNLKTNTIMEDSLYGSPQSGPGRRR